MKNMAFQYLYRDGANYKKWSEVTFSNMEGLQAEVINKLLGSAFLPDGLFIARQIRIPEVFLTEDYPMTPEDHCFHEFWFVEATSAAITDQYKRSIEDFLSEVLREAARGWKAFDSQMVGPAVRVSGRVPN
jgi:hypothetical protein